MNEVIINGETYVKKEPNNFELNINELTTNQIAANAFQLMGYKILTMVDGTENGPDMHIMKNDLIFRVEIKSARKSNRSMAVHPVEKNRKNDDLIAIV